MTDEIHLFAASCVVPAIVGIFSPRAGMVGITFSFTMLAFGVYGGR